MYLEEDRESRLKEIAQGLFNQNNVHIFEFKIFRKAQDVIVRFLVDKPNGGISIDECSYLNKEFIAKLEAEKMLDENFVLEISSPGIDRDLKVKEDFLRIVNKEIACFLKVPYEGKLEIQGKLIQVENDSIVIYNIKEIKIKLSDIARAKQVITLGR